MHLSHQRKALLPVNLELYRFCKKARYRCIFPADGNFKRATVVEYEDNGQGSTNRLSNGFEQCGAGTFGCQEAILGWLSGAVAPFFAAVFHASLKLAIPHATMR